MSPRVPGGLNVALTFDDGYLEHHKIASFLYKRNVRATFFLITGLREWNNKPLLTLQPRLIREMQRMNHEIASHTQSHPDLLTVSDQAVHRELHDSKDYLEDLLGREVEGFAYPYGTYDDRITRIVSSYYQYARAARELDSSTKYEIPIRSPGMNFRRCVLSLTMNMMRRRGFATLLMHSIEERSLGIWVNYLKAFGVRFLTLSELVATKYN
jgi:peptidoglycan/xylan/chitin deacetylase (PgdA/CDA1 family)